MAVVKTPVEGFTGKVAGVAFVDGVGETKDAGALAYFGRHGYTIERAAPAAPVVVTPSATGAPDDTGNTPPTGEAGGTPAPEGDTGKTPPADPKPAAKK